MWQWPWTVAETATAIGALMGAVSFVERRLEKALARREAARVVRPDVEVDVYDRGDAAGVVGMRLVIRNRWRNTLEVERLVVHRPAGVLLQLSDRTPRPEPAPEIPLGWSIHPKDTPPSSGEVRVLRHAGDKAYLRIAMVLPPGAPRPKRVVLDLHVVLKAATERREVVRVPIVL